MSLPWTTKETKFLSNLVGTKPVNAYMAFAKKFGTDRRSYDSVQKKLRALELDAESKLPDSEDFDELLLGTLGDKDNDYQAKLRQKLGGPDLRREELEQKRISRVKVQEFTDELIALSPSPFIRREKDLTGSSLVVLLSDTHDGKLTQFFNKDVFKERILSIPQQIVDGNLLDDDTEEIVLVLAGDMIEGEDIYHTQAHHIEDPVIDQVKHATKVFWQLALDLQEAFGLVVRFETCPGNHGRVSRTANGKSNWDNIIYQTLGFIADAAELEDIIVNVNMDNFHTFQVQDKRGLIFHHGTKHLGTPAMKTKVAGWLEKKKFDFMMHGHWHEWNVSPLFGRLVMKNGSLCGEDDLAEQMGAVDPPRQGWMLVRRDEPISKMGFFQWENEDL